MPHCLDYSGTGKDRLALGLASWSRNEERYAVSHRVLALRAVPNRLATCLARILAPGFTEIPGLLGGGIVGARSKAAAQAYYVDEKSYWRLCRHLRSAGNGARRELTVRAEEM